jgi:hypothetical protein
VQYDQVQFCWWRKTANIQHNERAENPQRPTRNSVRIVPHTEGDRYPFLMRRRFVVFFFRLRSNVCEVRACMCVCVCVCVCVYVFGHFWLSFPCLFVHVCASQMSTNNVSKKQRLWREESLGKKSPQASLQTIYLSVMDEVMASLSVAFDEHKVPPEVC